MILPKFLPNRNSFKGDCAFSIIDIRLFSLSAQEVWPQENEIDLSLALLTQLKNGNECRFKHAAFGWDLLSK
jgi:hypothetical protein